MSDLDIDLDLDLDLLDDSSDFDIDLDLDLDIEVKSYKKSNDKDFTKIQKQVIKNLQIQTIKAEHLTQFCSYPEVGEIIRVVTNRQYNAFALILQLLNKYEFIEELTIAIYRINFATVLSIIDLINAGKIKKANFLLSNFFRENHKYEKWAETLYQFGQENKNTTIKFSQTHAKVTLAKCGDNYYIFEGSGNMSDNARVEQYIYENNIKVYNFHYAWINEIIGSK